MPRIWFIAALPLLALGACTTASLPAKESVVEQLSGAPGMVCTELLIQNEAELKRLKGALQ